MKIKTAKKSDIKSIFALMQALARHEGALESFKCAQDELYSALFVKKLCQCIVGKIHQKGQKRIVGFALYYPVFASFLGAGGLRLECLYILPEFRGKGYGKKIFLSLVKRCKKKHYKRLEWICLSNNTSGLSFYESLGAKALNQKGFFTFYLEDKALREFQCE